jgi:hypothetical protein
MTLPLVRRTLPTESGSIFWVERPQSEIQTAYMVTHFWPAGTEEQYRVTVAAATQATGGDLAESFHGGRD